MSSFSPAETVACCRLIELALNEDLGLEPAATLRDVTSMAVVPPGYDMSATVVARTPGILAGLPAFTLVLGAVGNRFKVETSCEDGTELKAGQPIAVISGPMHDMLAAERTALNFLQRLSGVATLTKQYVAAVQGLQCQILDTRKTTPGWRLLEKYAVRCGGGHNHRMGLYDMVLIKDNHLAATRFKLSIAAAIRLGRREPLGMVGPVPVEIEVDTLEQLRQALTCASLPDFVLLDNMAVHQLREAVAMRNATAPKVLLEASGGVNLQAVRAIAETGVDRISVGALTHSAPALDIALDYLPA